MARVSIDVRKLNEPIAFAIVEVRNYGKRYEVHLYVHRKRGRVWMLHERRTFRYENDMILNLETDFPGITILKVDEL